MKQQTPMQDLFNFLEKYYTVLTPSTIEMMKDVYIMKEKHFAEDCKYDGMNQGIKLFKEKLKENESI